jgi:hypothetical protein
MRNYNVTAIARELGAIGAWDVYRTSMSCKSGLDFEELRIAAIDAVIEDGMEIYAIETIERQA